MKTLLYCHKCKKEHNVLMTDVLIMQLYSPKHLESEGLKFSYQSGCFLRKLNQVKRNHLAS